VNRAVSSTARWAPRMVAGLLFLAGFSPGSALAAGYRGYNDNIPSIGGGLDNPDPKSIDIIENLGQNVPAGLTFVDGHGAAVALADVLGKDKPVLVTLGYFHCPMLCNLVHEALARSVKEAKLTLGQDFLGLAVSIDPKEDPRSANTNQGRLLRSIRAGQKSEWPFVFDRPDAGDTGSAALAKSLGFRYFYDESSKQFAHAAAAFVLTPEGKISRYLYGTDIPARDLRLALVEAGGGRVGTTLDKVLQTCFKYDPMKQKYTPYVFGFVRIGAGLSCLALVVLLAVLWRKELQMRRIRRRTA
jgi:protein SCO1/2